MLSGATQLFMMKADVMDNFDTIKIATGYKINGAATDRYPYEVDVPVEPIYKEFKGWKAPLSGCRTEKDLPQELLDYVRFIEQQTGVPVKFISVGPDRKETVLR
jgi:adenylosuccinate synthase